jgi:hypothetical protein
MELYIIIINGELIWVKRMKLPNELFVPDQRRWAGKLVAVPSGLGCARLLWQVKKCR